MRKVLIVLSGGQDSVTAMFWAKQNIAEEVHAITFDYGQRHAIEIESAKKTASMLPVASHEIITLPEGILKGSSPLVDKSAEVGHYESVEKLPGGIEPTFVPGRNALFAVIAANRAYVLQCHSIVLGVNQADYGGYPDCRKEFIDLMSAALHSGVYGTTDAANHPILTPLMDLNKKQIVELAQTLPGCMDALAHSHSSYDGDYPPNPFNHASLLRAKGFAEAGVPDPLIVRAKKEGKLPTDYPDSGLVEGTKYASGLKPQKSDVLPELEKESLKGKKARPAADVP